MVAQKVIFFSIVTIIMGLFAANHALAQQAADGVPIEGAAPERRDGSFEITIKAPGNPVISADKLVRDRDLNPASLFRVQVGGYLGFDETDWVKEIRFRPEDVRVSELPQYKRFAQLLQDLNEKINYISNKLSNYDQMALRLVNICDQKRFGVSEKSGAFQDAGSGEPTSILREIDDEISQFITVYMRLSRLKELVVHSLNRFAKERACRSQFKEFSDILERYRRDLEILTKDFDSLMRRGITLSQDLKPAADQR